MRGQPLDPGQVHPAVAEHVEQDGKAPRSAGGCDAQVGLGLREVEPLGAPGECRRGRLAGKEAAHVHFADVGDEVGFGDS